MNNLTCLKTPIEDMKLLLNGLLYLKACGRTLYQVDAEVDNWVPPVPCCCASKTKFQVVDTCKNYILAQNRNWKEKCRRCEFIELLKFHLTDILTTRHFVSWRWRNLSWFIGISWTPLPRVASLTFKLFNMLHSAKEWKKRSPSCPLPKVRTSRFLIIIQRLAAWNYFIRTTMNQGSTSTLMKRLLS